MPLEHGKALPLLAFQLWVPPYDMTDMEFKIM